MDVSRDAQKRHCKKSYTPPVLVEYGSLGKLRKDGVDVESLFKRIARLKRRKEFQNKNVKEKRG